MQIKADFTRDELLKSPIDPIEEAIYPLSKLKSVAALLESFKPDDGFNNLHDDFLMGLSNIIEDSAKEIEYLIEVSSEQYHLKRKGATHA
nr:hypothetical protein [uncultured Desulfobacter sp.]